MRIMSINKLSAYLFTMLIMAGAFAPAIICAQNQEKQRSYTDAIKAYEAGDKEQALTIALDYKYGWDGAEVDGNKTIEWLDKAYEAGIIRAATIAGTMYWSGDVVKQDFAKAEKYYRKAASKGNEDAMVRLGQMYYYGNGVPVDYASAIKWYAAAAKNYEKENNCSIACVYLGELYVYGWDEGKVKKHDYKSAQKWLTKAYNAGFIEASATLSTVYAVGRTGVKQDKTKARQWLIAGAKKGYGLAQENLAEDYLYAKNGNADAVQAYVWASVLLSHDPERQYAIDLVKEARGALTSANKAKAERAASAAVKKFADIEYRLRSVDELD